MSLLPYALARSVLFGLDPETAHELTMASLARTQGIRIYNAALIEAEGRRVMVQSTDEAEIAIGIQRVLRERVVTACFIEGHGELPMDNMEFHTHLEAIADHSHGEASSKLVDMPGHGIGRLRRALEAQGYDARKIVLATLTGVPEACTLVIVASPRAVIRARSWNWVARSVVHGSPDSVMTSSAARLAAM